MRYLKTFENNNIVTLEELVKNMDGVLYQPRKLFLSNDEVRQTWTNNLEYLTRRIHESPIVANYFRQIIRELDQKKFGL